MDTNPTQYARSPAPGFFHIGHFCTRAQKTKGAIDILDPRRKSDPLPVQSTRQYACVFSSAFETFIKELRGFSAVFPVVNTSVQLFESAQVSRRAEVVLIDVSYDCVSILCAFFIFL